MTRRSEEMELKWLDIKALVEEIEELSKEYKLIQNRLALSRQILTAYMDYTANTPESAESKRPYLYVQKHSERTSKDSSDDSLPRSEEESLSMPSKDIEKQASTSSAKQGQSRGDLFIQVLREHPDQPQHYRDIFEMMKSFDPSIDWKNPAANLRTIVYLMRKHGDERIESIGNGYYKVARQAQKDENEKHE